MNLALLVGVLLFFFGTPAQRKPGPNACDHAAPPRACAGCAPPRTLATVISCPLDQEARIWMRLKNPVHQPWWPSASPSRIDYFVVPGYPAAAINAQKQGSVSATLVLTAEGVVQEVRIQSGDPEFAKAARLAFQQWWFAPGGRPENIPVHVRFTLSDSPAGPVTGTSLLNLVVTAQPVR